MESYLIQAAKEYSVGDRVRVYADGKELAKGVKGNVEFVREGTIGIVANVEGQTVRAFFTAPELEIVASHGEVERTKDMYGLRWVGINQPEQLLELEDHIRAEVSQGKGYLRIEDFLMSMGYGVNMIRKAFKKLYDMSAQDATNYEGWFDSPGSIPQFTIGWGYAKRGGDIYFIAPGVTWYSIMCQKDDMNRVEVSQHCTLAEAVDAIEKLVKKLERYCPAVKDLKLSKKGEPTDTASFSKMPQIFMQAGDAVGAAGEESRTIYVAKNKITGEIMYGTASFNRAATEGGIAELDNPSDYEIWSGPYNMGAGPSGNGVGASIIKKADAEKDMQEEAVREQLSDVEKQTMKRPIKEELSEKTPKQFFERKKVEQRYAMLPANVIDSVSQYLAKASSSLEDFDLAVASFKYTTIQPAGDLSKSTPLDEPDVMNSTASVSVLLEITDKRSESGVNKKLGLMVFSIIRNDLFTTDTVKGEDDQIFALTDEGLQGYFRQERGVGGQKK